MEAKDVKVGMKVVPYDKTDCMSWETWIKSDYDTAKGFRDHGFLVVKNACSDGTYALVDANGNGGAGFNASDFSPAEIEVGDTVRLDCSCHKGQSGTVTRIEPQRGGAKWYSVNAENGTTASPCTDTMVVLIRKAPKQKEGKPMSKRPRLEEININCVVKLRNEKICVLLDREGIPVFYGASQFGAGEIGGYIAKHNIREDLKAAAQYGRDFDIVAVKKFRHQTAAIAAAMSKDIGNWDWTEDMDKPLPIRTLKDVKDALGACVLDLNGSFTEIK